MFSFYLDISKEKSDWSVTYGDCIGFDLRDGVLSINLWDGHTMLSKEEALKLGEVLIKWAKN